MKKKLTAAVLILSILCAALTTAAYAADEELPFYDVNENSWYYDAVSYVYQRGIMTGVGDSQFDPNGGMNRAMFVTVLGRLYGGREIRNDSFPDVDRNSWYGGWVGWAVDAGLVKGFEDGTFKPFDRITRAEMAALMTRYLNYDEVIPTHSWSSRFTDEESIPGWAEEYAEQMRQAGLVAGDENGRFNANDNLTRAEAATVICRLCEMLEELTLTEPTKVSYAIEGENCCFLSGLDLYYSGRALTSDFPGVMYDTDDGYYVSGDPDGRCALTNDQTRWLQYLVDVPNSIASGHYFGIDIRQLGISLEEYPAFRIGYRTTDGAPVKFGVYAVTTNSVGTVTEDASRLIEISPKSESDHSGWSYFTVDLSAEALPESASELSLTVMTDGSGLELHYLGAFGSIADAEAADPSRHWDSVHCPEAGFEYLEDDDEMSESLNGIADILRDSILSAENLTSAEDISGKCYYISSFRGDDSNNGLSPETPWKSISKLYTTKADGQIVIDVPKSGDAVFFERNSVFCGEIGTHGSGNRVLTCAPGVTYAAYGEGEKPLFTNAIDASSSTAWSSTEYPNIYRLSIPFNVPDTAESDGYSDVGSISINGGELWGVKVTVTDPSRPYSGEGTDGEAAYTSMTSNCGTVTNGRDIFSENSREFTGPDCLNNELEYFHDWKDNALYIYCSKGNPGEVFESVILSPQGYGISAADGAVLENLAVKYTGSHGVSIGSGKDVVIRLCDLEWIGGSIQGGTTRFGNAIENWGDCDGILVDSCYINQCYDTGVTTQGDNGHMINMTISQCIIDRCTMAVEFFNSEANPEYDNLMANIFVENNFMRYCGYGFGSGRSDKKATFFEGSNFSRGKSIKNVRFRYNCCLYSADYCFSDDSIACGEKAPGISFSNNIYVMYRNAYLVRTASNIAERTGNNYTYYPYTEQYMMQLSSLGIEQGSTFISYSEPLDDLERNGFYSIPIDR